MFRRLFVQINFGLSLLSLGMVSAGSVGLGSPCVTDVTTQWTYNGEAISAFPGFYEGIPKEENALIIRVFKINPPAQATSTLERRLEVFYTGGDWMEFGYTWFVTDARNRHHPGPGEYGGAYFIADMSTPDREDGAVPPKVDPLNDAELQRFICDQFFEESREVRAEFSPFTPVDEGIP